MARRPVLWPALVLAVAACTALPFRDGPMLSGMSYTWNVHISGWVDNGIELGLSSGQFDDLAAEGHRARVARFTEALGSGDRHQVSLSDWFTLRQLALDWIDAQVVSGEFIPQEAAFYIGLVGDFDVNVQTLLSRQED